MSEVSGTTDDEADSVRIFVPQPICPLRVVPMDGFILTFESISDTLFQGPIDCPLPPREHSFVNQDQRRQQDDSGTTSVNKFIRRQNSNLTSSPTSIRTPRVVNSNNHNNNNNNNSSSSNGYDGGNELRVGMDFTPQSNYFTTRITTTTTTTTSSFRTGHEADIAVGFAFDADVDVDVDVDGHRYSNSNYYEKDKISTPLQEGWISGFQSAIIPKFSFRSKKESNNNTQQQQQQQQQLPFNNFGTRVLGLGQPFALSPAPRAIVVDQDTTMYSTARSSPPATITISPTVPPPPPPQRTATTASTSAATKSIAKPCEGPFGEFLRTLHWAFMGLFCLFLLCRLDAASMGTQSWMLASFTRAAAKSWWIVFCPLLTINSVSSCVLILLVLLSYDSRNKAQAFSLIFGQSGYCLSLVLGNPFLFVSEVMLIVKLEGWVRWPLIVVIQPFALGCLFLLLYLLFRREQSRWMLFSIAIGLLLGFVELLALLIDGYLPDWNFAAVFSLWFCVMIIWICMSIVMTAKALRVELLTILFWRKQLGSNEPEGFGDEDDSMSEMGLLDRSLSMSMSSSFSHGPKRVSDFIRSQGAAGVSMLITACCFTAVSILIVTSLDSGNMGNVPAPLLHRSLFPILFGSGVFIVWWILTCIMRLLPISRLAFMEFSDLGVLWNAHVMTKLSSVSSPLLSRPLNTSIGSNASILSSKSAHRPHCATLMPKISLFRPERRMLGILRMLVAWSLVAFVAALTINANTLSSSSSSSPSSSKSWWLIFIPKFVIDLCFLVLGGAPFLVTWKSRGFVIATQRLLQRSSLVMCLVLGSPFLLISETLLCLLWENPGTLPFLQVVAPLLGGLTLIAVLSLVTMISEDSLISSSFFVFSSSLCAAASLVLFCLSADGFSISPIVAHAPLWGWCGYSMFVLTWKVHDHISRFSEGIHRSFTLFSFIALILAVSVPAAVRENVHDGWSICWLIFPFVVFAVLHSMWAIQTLITETLGEVEYVSFVQDSDSDGTEAVASWSRSDSDRAYGCLSRYIQLFRVYRVEIKEMSQSEWTHIAVTRGKFVRICNLNPQSPYVVRITTHSLAGATSCAVLKTMERESSPSSSSFAVSAPVSGISMRPQPSQFKMVTTTAPPPSARPIGFVPTAIKPSPNSPLLPVQFSFVNPTTEPSTPSSLPAEFNFSPLSGISHSYSPVAVAPQISAANTATNNHTLKRVRSRPPPIATVGIDNPTSTSATTTTTTMKSPSPPSASPSFPSPKPRLFATSLSPIVPSNHNNNNNNNVSNNMPLQTSKAPPLFIVPQPTSPMAALFGPMTAATSSPPTPPLLKAPVSTPATSSFKKTPTNLLLGNDDNESARLGMDDTTPPTSATPSPHLQPFRAKKEGEDSEALRKDEDTDPPRLWSINRDMFTKETANVKRPSAFKPIIKMNLKAAPPTPNAGNEWGELETNINTRINATTTTPNNINSINNIADHHSKQERTEPMNSFFKVNNMVKKFEPQQATWFES